MCILGGKHLLLRTRNKTIFHWGGGGGGGEGNEFQPPVTSATGIYSYILYIVHYIVTRAVFSTEGNYTSTS